MSASGCGRFFRCSRPSSSGLDIGVSSMAFHSTGTVDDENIVVLRKKKNKLALGRARTRDL